MKFQSYRLSLGQWIDQPTGKTLDGVVGLIPDRVIEAPSVRLAMHQLRSYRNPSPIVSVIEEGRMLQ